MTWDPQLYLKFNRERTQPAIDLAARIEITEPQSVIDLGCGPGNSTAVLKARWPEADITGLDSDADMLAAARLKLPEANWVQADAANWQRDRQYEVVFSNAMLQWLPDHARVIENWFSAVAEGGALAVQIPINFSEPVHRHILEVADDPRWSDLTNPAKRSLRASDVADYYEILSRLSERIELWVTNYIHQLDGPLDIINWMRGTGLRPYLDVLSADQKLEFEAVLLSRLEKSYPPQSNRKVLYPFRRLFFVTYR